MGANDVNVHLSDVFDLLSPCVVILIEDLFGYFQVPELVIERVLIVDNV